MNRIALIALLPLAWAGSAAAQPMTHDMPGMTMPATKAKPAAKPGPRATPPTDPHAGHNMSATPPADPHAGHDMPANNAPVDAAAPANSAAAPVQQPGHDMRSMLTAPATSPPPPPGDHLADRFFSPARMEGAREELRAEHGGSRVSLFLLDQAEFLVVKSEGEGARRQGLERAELQAVYARAIGPYFNLQAGVRHDFKPTPSRTFATVGVEGVAPYWFKLDSAVYLSNQGEVLARFKGSYDLRFTQRLILQPDVEMNFSAQNSRQLRLGSGLTDVEAGLRLRYEIRREFAPYVGVLWQRKFGDTADFARAEGERAGSTSLVVGVRAWF
ncbi:copper resistance protein B [Phenylobacterium sp. CCH12-B4]|uniref:copper resistance protein B n=1 Tax=Phenylobacterium sp. CCH12-B4 TaxID=1768784 RepID=UPI00083B1EC7|nr:copper resistance protein B [Phenylobacterium sp. CCH12-B4]